MPSDPMYARGPGARGWRWWIHAIGMVLRGTTWRVALPIALVVGTILGLVNQGAELASGNADTATAVRLVANYAIPYLVSSIGYLSALTRDAPAPPHATDSRVGRSPG